jgi:type III pantothenate kinase
VYLTLDIGNTRSKFALFDTAGKLLQSGVSDNVAELISSHAQLSGLAYCNVSGAEFATLHDFKGFVLEMNSSQKLPFRLNYQTPQTLGADRLAAAAGAVHFFPGKDVLIVDAGTCLKIDWVDKNSVFQGGSISPGLNMRYRALKEFTGRLPMVEDEEFNHWPGSSTKESILSGVRLGFLAEAETRIEEIEKNCPGVQVVLTGGDAHLLAKRLKTRIFVEPLLLHFGLFELLLLNEN